MESTQTHGVPLVIAPTHAEAAAVRKAIADLLTSGTLELLTCGMGVERATALCRQLEARENTVRSLALIGWAGGLDPRLTAGTVLLGDVAINERGQRSPCAVIPLAGATVGPLLTVEHPLLTSRSKSQARHSTAIAAEMEAYPLAAWAWQRGIPFVHVRVVLDAAAEDLPDVGAALDPLGRPRLLPLARQFLAHPGLIRAVARIGRRATSLNPALGAAARAMALSLLDTATG